MTFLSRRGLVRAILPFCLLLAATLALPACGKKGPPQPPGPADKIIYPRAYPTTK